MNTWTKEALTDFIELHRDDAIDDELYEELIREAEQALASK